ncbi:hypothetical protein ZIOFF_067437 [Zingiber officinale]|uniref:LOB domain-containing protein n=1 Tax=Zingiber officinale TaxID=94328 RepID=A0A8J5CAB5_ZINOF|nr:hypothetical protein ZIOFF_067437 [Zingiber officinale]
MASSTSGTGVGSPCGACKFLRRRCTQECVFAPYFDSEQSPAQFAAIHKVFGASNVSKLLAQLPVHLRCDAVVTVAYEAQARIRDPVYGCVSMLQAQLMQVKAQLAYQASSSTLPPAANGGSDGDRLLMQQVMGCKEEPHHHFGELHAMAQRLMRS